MICCPCCYERLNLQSKVWQFQNNLPGVIHSQPATASLCSRKLWQYQARSWNVTNAGNYHLVMHTWYWKWLRKCEYTCKTGWSQNLSIWNTHWILLKGNKALIAVNLQYLLLSWCMDAVSRAPALREGCRNCPKEIIGMCKTVYFVPLLIFWEKDY